MLLNPTTYHSNTKSKQIVDSKVKRALLFTACFIKRIKRKKTDNKFSISIRLLQMKVSVSNSVVYEYFF